MGSPKDVQEPCSFVIDSVAREADIMDASALILSDAKIENVKAMIEFTLDHGTYSRRCLHPLGGEKTRASCYFSN